MPRIRSEGVSGRLRIIQCRRPGTGHTVNRGGGQRTDDGALTNGVPRCELGSDIWRHGHRRSDRGRTLARMGSKSICTGLGVVKCGGPAAGNVVLRGGRQWRNRRSCADQAKRLEQRCVYRCDIYTDSSAVGTLSGLRNKGIYSALLTAERR